MKFVVFAPGIMGSELKLRGEQKWPSLMAETVFGFGDFNALLSDDLVPASVIRKVGVIPIYRSIMEDIRRCGYTEGSNSHRFLPFPYKGAGHRFPYL